MENPFDNPDGTYCVLINGEGQYSLWPAFADVPQGWVVELADASRDVCLAHVAEHWVDMRPKSLREAG